MIYWGILGAGNIAHRFAASLQNQQNSVLTAISCRRKEKAEAFVAQFPAKRSYTEYDALLADPQIDAIYVALPHSLHKEWSVKALQAGKAVLCEKPATMSAEEMCAVAKAAQENGVLFMEAMKQRFVPLYQEIKKQLAAGTIGRITGIQTSLCNAMPFEQISNTYHTQPGQGGVLLDCGIYCASWLEDFLPGTPQVTHSTANIQKGVDYYVDAMLSFDDIPARLECAFDRAKPRQAILQGTAGRLVVEELHRPQAMTVYLDGQPGKRIAMPYIVDDFYTQIDHFVHCLQQGKTESPVMPLAASIRCAQILDSIRVHMGDGVA